jgi:hypothetical protein
MPEHPAPAPVPGPLEQRVTEAVLSVYTVPADVLPLLAERVIVAVVDASAQPVPGQPPEVELSPLGRMVHEMRDELGGVYLVLSRVATLLSDAQSAWHSDRRAARQLVDRAAQLAGETLR